MNVRFGRRGHLELLDAARTGRGIEDDDLGAVHAGEALHRGRTGIAARRGENQDAFAVRGMAHEDGKHGKRDVLERASLAEEELENVEPVLLDQRNRIAGREAAQEAVDRILADRFREVAEQRVTDETLSIPECLDI